MNATTCEILKLMLEIRYDLLLTRDALKREDDPDKPRIQAELANHPANPINGPLTHARIRCLFGGGELAAAVHAAKAGLAGLPSKPDPAPTKPHREPNPTNADASSAGLACAVAVTKANLTSWVGYNPQFQTVHCND
jgi:hypothetical protein